MTIVFPSFLLCLFNRAFPFACSELPFFVYIELGGVQTMLDLFANSTA